MLTYPFLIVAVEKLQNEIIEPIASKLWVIQTYFSPQWLHFDGFFFFFLICFLKIYFGLKMNVNRSQLEVMSYHWWAVCVHLFGGQMIAKLSLFCFSKLLSVWTFGQDFSREHLLNWRAHQDNVVFPPSILISWLQSLVYCRFDIFIFVKISWTSQFGDEHWRMFCK